MSQINGVKVEGVKLENTLKYITKIIRIANTFEGKVFGEYVREVIIPRWQDESCKVKFGGLAIWFKTEIECSKFINFMNTVEHDCHGGHVVPKNNLSDIDLVQYQCRPNDLAHFSLNTNVSEKYPINDFDVNCLTYYYVNNVPTFGLYDGVSYYTKNDLQERKDELVRAIYMKRATIVNSSLFEQKTEIVAERIKIINEKYIANGWTIKYGDIEFKTAIIGTIDEAIAEVRKVEKEKNENIIEKDVSDKLFDLGLSCDDFKLLQCERDSVEKKIKIPNKWSSKAAGKAANNNKFIWVNEDWTGLLSMSDAEKLWSNDMLNGKDTIFDITYRIAGTPKNITKALKDAGYCDTQISDSIRDSISKDNYTKRTEYTEELEKSKPVDTVKELKSVHDVKELKSVNNSKESEKNTEVKKGLHSGLVYCSEEVEKAKAEHEFIWVCGNYVGRIPLTSAIKFWNDVQNDSIIFNLDYRIAGRPENISTVLKYYKTINTDDEFKSLLNTSINKDNYNSSKKSEYTAELLKCEQYKFTKKLQECRDFISANAQNSVQKPIQNTIQGSARKQLIDNFIACDKAFKKSIIERNRAFIECVTDLEIVDNTYISNNMVGYPEQLNMERIIK